jgi:hypothetical protein
MTSKETIDILEKYATYYKALLAELQKNNKINRDWKEGYAECLRDVIYGLESEKRNSIASGI